MLIGKLTNILDIHFITLVVGIKATTITFIAGKLGIPTTMLFMLLLL